VAYATLSRHNGVLCGFRLSPLGREGHQGVHGAPNALAASVQHVRVDHRSLDVSMTKKLLNGSDVVPVLQEVRREGVAESVAGGMLVDPCSPCGSLDRSLNQRLVYVVASLLAGAGIHPALFLGEQELPPPIPRSLRVLPGKSVRKLDPSITIREIAGVDTEIWLHTCWGNPNQQPLHWERPSYERSLPYLLRTDAHILTTEGVAMMFERFSIVSWPLTASILHLRPRQIPTLTRSHSISRRPSLAIV